jgi:cardiolipin synthase
MRYIPNLLSGARLLAAPYVCRLLWDRDFKSALLWMAIIGATDGFDGYLARRFQWQSKLGAMLDPLADKVLLSGAFLTLGLSGQIPAWLAWLVLGRDAVILIFAAGVLLLTQIRREFPPTYLGKLSTTFQIVYVLLVAGAGAGWVPLVVAYVGSGLVALVTAWSGVDYARLASSTLKAPARQP